jgi:phage gp29-like protein
MVMAQLPAVQQQSTLVDHLGRPIVREVLTQYLSQPTVSGTRQAVFGHVTAGLGPQDMAGMMIEAEQGDPQAYLALAEEIEEKDLHYAAVLGTRKRQVAQLDITVKAPGGATGDRGDVITDAVQNDLVDSGIIRAALFDMLDAVGKGFSLTEIMWKTNASKWPIDRLEHVEPRFVRFDRITRRVPLLLGDNGLPQALAPFKFIYTEIGSKSGIPIRGGLARPVAWAWMFKNYALKDWIQFIEVYGQPWRIGKFAPGASQSDQDALLRAVISLASDAGCVIPSTMSIDLVEASKGSTSSSSAFESFCRYLDEQVSKIVLGQTGTTDSAPSGIGNQSSRSTHNDVRGDIERADAAALSVAIDAQLVKPYVDLNFGPQARYPSIIIGRPEEQDAALMVQAVQYLVPLGLEIRQQDLRRVIGATEPQPGDKLFSGKPPADPNAPPPPPPESAVPFAQPHLLQLPKPALALARTRAALLASEIVSRDDDVIARMAFDQAKDSDGALQPLVDQLIAAAAASKNADEFRAHLRTLDPDITLLADKLAMLTFQSVAGAILGETP